LKGHYFPEKAGRYLITAGQAPIPFNELPRDVGDDGEEGEVIMFIISVSNRYN
jgi:hypothetical protein